MGLDRRNAQPDRRPVAVADPSGYHRTPLRLRDGPGAQRTPAEPGAPTLRIARPETGDHETQNHPGADAGGQLTGRIGELRVEKILQRYAGKHLSGHGGTGGRPDEQTGVSEIDAPFGEAVQQPDLPGDTGDAATAEHERFPIDTHGCDSSTSPPTARGHRGGIERASGKSPGAGTAGRS
jgi:hypothetical protein